MFGFAQSVPEVGVYLVRAVCCRGLNYLMSVLSVCRLCCLLPVYVVWVICELAMLSVARCCLELAMLSVLSVSWLCCLLPAVVCGISQFLHYLSAVSIYAGCCLSLLSADHLSILRGRSVICGAYAACRLSVYALLAVCLSCLHCLSVVHLSSLHCRFSICGVYDACCLSIYATCRLSTYAA